MKALCFGSLNIDFVYDVPHFVAAGETLASDGLTRFCGGKGLNQSIALARAGAEVFHAGAVGADGGFLLDALREAGVDTSLIDVRDDVRTGHAVIQRTPDGGNCILLYGGANRQITRAQIDRALARFSAGDALVVQNEISEPGYLMRQAKARGMRVALNPSPMEDALAPLLPLADWLLLNETEAAQLLGDGMPASYADAARLLHARTGGAVILTLGAEGALYADADGVTACSAKRVRAVDTTAAGDTFTGYFLAAALAGKTPAQALRYASSAAAIAVTRPGAAPSIPTRGEVLALDCVSVANMRESDRKTIESYVPSLTLMYRAAMGVYRACAWRGDIAIAVGSGNNGGDGFALACILKSTGVGCRVVTLSDRLSADSAHFAQRAKALGVPAAPYADGAFAGCDLIVDCLLGTGFHGAVREPYAAAIREINASGAFVVSVDINSGMNGDTGEAALAVRSDLTVTIGFVKNGMLAANAGDFMKRLVVTDIGIVLDRAENRIAADGLDARAENGTVFRRPPYLDMDVIDTRDVEYPGGAA